MVPEQAVSNGTCTLALDLQTYSGPIERFVLPLSDHFDLILGDNWCNETGCEVSHHDHCPRCNDHDGRRHNMIIQPDQHQVHWPVISAVNLNTKMEEGDAMYLVDVICIDETLDLNSLDFDAMPAVPEDATLQELLDRFADRFFLKLPAELPPVLNVYHCIPLKNNELPAPPKSYLLSRPELAEMHSQVTSLLAKGYIQPSTHTHTDFTVVGGQLAHLTKLQFFISKRNRQNSNVDESSSGMSGKLSPCLGSL